MINKAASINLDALMKLVKNRSCFLLVNMAVINSKLKAGITHFHYFSGLPKRGHQVIYLIDFSFEIYFMNSYKTKKMLAILEVTLMLGESYKQKF
jgi:hypothetical protein